MESEHVIDATEKFTKNIQESREKKPFFQDLLLIEDDDLCLFVGYDILARLTSGKIDTAKTAMDAAQKLRQNRYDLVISDLCLTGGNAIDLMSEAQTQSWSKNRNTPFIAVTAYRDIDKHQEALAVGFKVVIAKPLTEDQARLFLENYLGPYSSTDSIPIIKRPVIDLMLGMERIGAHTEEKAIKALELLIASLPQELLVLKNAEAKHDRATMGQILHKLVGALNYSGTPALEKAAQDLQTILKLDEPAAISKGVKDIQEQVKLLKAAYYDLLMDDA